ncbi:MAG: signal peptidase I [Culicoidibacterales bacterium]
MEVQNEAVINEEKQLDEPIGKKKKTKSKTDRFLNIAIVILLILTCCMFAYRSFTGEAIVRGRSMENTLVNEEKLLYEKLTGHVGDYNKKDILILKEGTVKQMNEDQEGLIVKRLIAKAGDTVDFTEDGKPIVNGEKLVESYIKEQTSDRSAHFSLVLEKTNEKYNEHFDLTSNKVPEGYYFVMGDNRNNSSDSRVFGLFKKADIVGHVVYSWTYQRFY